MTETASVGEVGSAYAGIRGRVRLLVEEADDARRVRLVPGCPEWRVHDVVAHLAGVADDVAGGRLDGAGTDPWTAAQVAARRDRPTDELLDEWDDVAPRIEAIIDSFGRPGRQLVMDAVSHEHDLRGALDSMGARDSDAVTTGLDWLLASMTAAATRAGHPPLLLRSTEGGEWSSVAGAEPVATLTATSFDLLRAGSGRRTVEEIRALDWQGDVDRALPSFSFGPFTPCATSLGE